MRALVADLRSMVKIGEEALRAALKRCARESGHAELNQDRYYKWRASLEDPRVVPGPLAFGSASDFEQFCEACDVPCLAARGKAAARSTNCSANTLVTQSAL